MKPRALITGASRGIGRAIALELARAGHPVIINYRRDDDAAHATQEEIIQSGGSAVLSCFDVADREMSHEAIARLLEDPMPIGVIVNNAGIARDNAFPSISSEDWDAVIQTTLMGFYNVTHPLVMHLVRQRWGRIVNMASVSGVTGNRGQTNYSAAKAGLIGATKALAQELAKRRITVNAVAPGLIDTDMLQSAPVDELLKYVPMHRLGTAQEVASLVGFLVSDSAAYITGQVIGINGGLA